MRQRLRRAYFAVIKAPYLSNRIGTIIKGNVQNQLKSLLTKPIPAFIIDAINEASPRFIVGKMRLTRISLSANAAWEISLHPLDETKGAYYASG